MMKRSLVTAVALLAACLATLHSTARDCCEATSELKELTLAETKCSQEDGITRVQLAEKLPPSPYATEFDRRVLTIVYGSSLGRVMQEAGIQSIQHKDVLITTRLTRPPAEENILVRIISSERTAVEEWTVLIEHIQYAAQGQLPGYALDCATAIRRRKDSNAAVAECFAVEERIRFFDLLRHLD